MKKKLGMGFYVGFVSVWANLLPVAAYNESGNANLSGGLLILLLPVMLGIIYLASNSEVK